MGELEKGADKLVAEALQKASNRLHKRVSQLKLEALRAEMRLGRILAFLNDNDLLKVIVEAGEE